MPWYQESCTEIFFPKEIERFDTIMADVSHALKSVDFLYEEDNEIYFIEIKNVAHPRNPLERDLRSKNDVRSKLLWDLARKFRDSFLFVWASNRLASGLSKIHKIYACFLKVYTLDDALVLTMNDELNRILPIRRASPKWEFSIVDAALIIPVRDKVRKIKNIKIKPKTC